MPTEGFKCTVVRAENPHDLRKGTITPGVFYWADCPCAGETRRVHVTVRKTDWDSLVDGLGEKDREPLMSEIVCDYLQEVCGRYGHLQEQVELDSGYIRVRAEKLKSK